MSPKTLRSLPYFTASLIASSPVPASAAVVTMRSVLSTSSNSCQPRCKVPTSSPGAMRTSSKKTLLDASVRVPTLSIAVCVRPLRSTSIMNIDRPSLRDLQSASFLVRATTSILAASGTPVIQILRPFRRQPSASASA